VSELDEVDSGLYLTHTAMAIGPRTVPVIAGMLTPETAAALRGPVEQPRAVVNTLLPHDGEAIVTRTDPDVVLIESAALGAPGPWAYTTQGAYGSRDRAVVDILTAARAMGRPVVVWWNSPAHATPGLNRIGAHADAVWTTADWDPGRLAELSTRLNLGYDRSEVSS
jgi:glucose-6-phosphate dehydrogenase assembly protein OpcA